MTKPTAATEEEFRNMIVWNFPGASNICCELTQRGWVGDFVVTKVAYWASYQGGKFTTGTIQSSV